MDTLWLEAIQELHSTLMSSYKSGSLFKGELILNIDSALGIYTQCFGHSQPVTAGLHSLEPALFSLCASALKGKATEQRFYKDYTD